MSRRGRADATGWTRPEEWRDLVVICSGTSWDGARLSDRHLAERLTRYAPVLYVDPPLSVLTPLRRPELRGSVRRPGLSRLGERLARVTPLAPPGVSQPGIRLLALLATRRAMRAAVRTLGSDVEAVIVGSLDDLLGVCGERQSVLWGTDDFASAGALMGISPEWLGQRETDQLAKATVVTTVSEELATRWRARGKDVSIISNGCDTAHYATSASAPLPSDVTLPHPIATFIGHLSDRIDLARLQEVADRGHSLLLVGPRQATFEIARFEALLQRPNVQWVGPKPFDELPSYLKVTTVGLTPYADSRFNRSSFPLKTLEYLAAGKQVVTTDLPSARWLDTDLITITETAREFGEATSRCLEVGPDSDFARRAMHFARKHDWSVRALH